MGSLAMITSLAPSDASDASDGIARHDRIALPHVSVGIRSMTY